MENKINGEMRPQEKPDFLFCKKSGVNKHSFCPAIADKFLSLVIDFLLPS